jgi:hypothetical protein
MANRLLLDLGLNVHSNTVTGTSVLTPDEVHLRRQIYWALYSNDKLWASYSGRVCTMLASPLSASAFPLLMFHSGLPGRCVPALAALGRGNAWPGPASPLGHLATRDGHALSDLGEDSDTSVRVPPLAVGPRSY